jgi:hypothetical protein
MEEKARVIISKNWNRIVEVGIDYGLKDLGVGFWFAAGVRKIAILHSVQTDSEPPIRLFILSWGLLPVVKLSGHEADHSALCNVKIKNAWSHASTFSWHGD